ncbi:hypothetical protein, partial [Pectobacterium aquaticum]|uniref:hypothetical protein n=1 Tax=Pectobacterium aquaticum TaxID=2204145 RepID=UPI001D0308FC
MDKLPVPVGLVVYCDIEHLAKYWQIKGFIWRVNRPFIKCCVAMESSPQQPSHQAESGKTTNPLCQDSC